jgi:hypothetical protein
MTDTADWEAIGRETAYWTLWLLLDDAEATIDRVSSPILWDHEVSPEEVAAMREHAFAVVYVTETYVARLCDETTPWDAIYGPKHDRPRPLPTVNTDGGEEGT